MHIVLIETSGNQRFIFATNKLRENVGASELTYRVSTEFVLKAVDEEKVSADGNKLWAAEDITSSQWRANLLNPQKNPPIGEKGNKIEVIIATSGKALLLVDQRTTGERIIRNVTGNALAQMPGLTVHGAISDVQDDLTDIHRAITDVHLRLEELRHQMPSNEQRFLRLPYAAPCSTSGLPAKHIKKYKEDNEPKRFSHLSYIKREARNSGYKRIRETLWGFNLIYPEHIEERNWTAVIHADGNGLGEVFLNFDEYAGFDSSNRWSGRRYIKDYRNFSLALDICTIMAIKTALGKLKESYLKEVNERFTGLLEKYQHTRRKGYQSKKAGNEANAKKLFHQAKALLHSARKLKKLPVVPLVLGGDDLTVLCDGQYALKFVRDFLNAFEEETKKPQESVADIVKQIANKAFGTDYLGICAGIAIIKPHYPFHQAYELAEQLLKSAKQVKTQVLQTDGRQLPCSALDFHILYDSAHSDLQEIREVKLKIHGDTYLSAKPYVVTENLEGQENNLWLRYRRFAELQARVEAMNEKDQDGKRLLPNSQLHSLRESLFLGRLETNARVNLIAHRYENEKGIHKKLSALLVPDTEELFFKEIEPSGEIHYATHFMDALDVVEFWQGFETVSTKKAEGSKKK